MKLKRAEKEDVSASPLSLIPEEILSGAARMIEEIRTGGIDALRKRAEALDSLSNESALLYSQSDLEKSLESITPEVRSMLERTRDRIRSFAEIQKSSLSPLDVDLGFGRIGHEFSPVDRVGAYAPGGRFAYPSSVLMTVCTARAAGVREVFVASPRPSAMTLAAAAIAGANGLLACGGAQAMAALAYGVGISGPCDVLCGPGNLWVTAAKKLLFGQVGIDMLAGPTELVIVADATASPVLVAADLVAQAEHDPEARVTLVSLSESLIAEVDSQLESQLRSLPTAGIACESLERNGRAILVSTFVEASEVCNRLAPEHLQIVVKDAEELRPLLRHYGALFIGSNSAEVFGDYGLGPNHVLPTMGTARFTGGLSVLTFLRLRTWSNLTRAPVQLVEDIEAFARLEGLEAHARAAVLRIRSAT